MNEETPQTITGDKTTALTPKDQDQTDTSKPAETKPANTQATDPAEPTTDHATPVKPDITPPTPEQPEKLADVVPTTLVWISGMVGEHQIDCAGPIELPFKITKPTWPYTPVEPNSTYTNQVFDYALGTWIATDAKSQGQQISDLAQKVQDLQKNSENHDKSADRAEKMGVQTIRILTSSTHQMSTISQKLDTV